MARHKDEEWFLPEEDYSDEQVIIAVLMDIRDELKRANLRLTELALRQRVAGVQIRDVLIGIRRKLPSKRERDTTQRKS